MPRSRWTAVGALAVCAGLHHAVRAADVHVVMVGTDSVSAPAPGSLRHILQNVAQPGDTIRFASPFVIVLDPKDSILRIDETLAGLTLEGPAELRGGSFFVTGDSATVTGMNFVDVFVHVGDSRDATSTLGISTDHVVFKSNRLGGKSHLEVNATHDARIADNTFDVRAVGGKFDSVSDENSIGSRWIHNIWPDTATGGFGEYNCSDFVFEGKNRVVGDATFATRSGRVEDNDVTGAIFVTAEQLAIDGPLVIHGNRCATLFALRPDLEVSRNTVTALPSTKRKPYVIRAGMAYSRTDAGYLRVVDNVVTSASGWLGGISVQANSNATELTVSGNTVDAAEVTGIQVIAAKTVTVSGNTVRTSGKGRQGGGIVVRGKAVGGITMENNTVTGGDGSGILLAGEKGASEAILRRNTVTGCGGAAVLAQRPMVSEDGTYGTSATGVVVTEKTRATVRGGSISGNRDAGVFADAGTTVEVARTAFGGNAGAGIDLSPGGVTANQKKKKANRNVDWPADLVFDEQTGRVTGKSEPGARIDVYAVEEGARAGNPGNGEGVQWIGEVVAGTDGAFVFPAAGRAPCPPSKKLTFTATRLPPGGVTFNARIETSEFSDDVECTGGPEIALVSQNSAGVPGDLPLYDIAPAGLRSRNVSDDGRFVVFESKATNLVAGDTNGLSDVFLRDTVAGTTIRVTRTAAGGQIEPSIGVNSEAGYGPSLSSDGRFVVYETRSDSVSGEDASNPAVILFDAQTGVNTVVASGMSRTVPYPSGRFGLFDGRGGAISGDGNVVAFSSLGADWVPGDAGDDYDMFVWTRATGAYERITVTSAGGDPQGGNNPANCGHPRLSHDGRFVAFYSNHDLINGGSPGPNVGVVRIWLRDRQAGTTEIVSLTDTGAASFGFDPWVSDDGRYVAYSSTAAIVADDTNGVEDVYLRDRQAGTTTRVSVDAAGAQRVGRSHSPAMSADGRFITFLSTGSYTFPGGGTVGNINDLFLADRQAGTVVEAGVGPNGEALGGCFSPRLSRTGSFLYFDTAASNLVDLGGQTFVNHAYLRHLTSSGN